MEAVVALWVKYGSHEDGWYLLDDQTGIEQRYGVKDYAILQGRRESARQRTELHICNMQGQIIEKDTGQGGSDPFPPGG